MVWQGDWLKSRKGAIFCIIYSAPGYREGRAEFGVAQPFRVKGASCGGSC